jgi:hypothetical protein
LNPATQGLTGGYRWSHTPNLAWAGMGSADPGHGDRWSQPPGRLGSCCKSTPPGWTARLLCRSDLMRPRSANCRPRDRSKPLIELINSFSRPVAAPATAAVSPSEVAKRKPVRVTLTKSCATHQRLLERSGYEGMSMRNLCAHILEAGAGQAPCRIFCCH